MLTHSPLGKFCLRPAHPTDRDYHRTLTSFQLHQLFLTYVNHAWPHGLADPSILLERPQGLKIRITHVEYDGCIIVGEV